MPKTRNDLAREAVLAGSSSDEANNVDDESEAEENDKAKAKNGDSSKAKNKGKASSKDENGTKKKADSGKINCHVSD